MCHFLIGYSSTSEDIDDERNGRKGTSAGSDIEYEQRLLMPDYSVKYLHLIRAREFATMTDAGYIGAVQDVTQRKSSEEALAKARSELAQSPVSRASLP